jgi:energy-coupling factor transporter ATP-binding protein EcfA2
MDFMNVLLDWLFRANQKGAYHSALEYEAEKSGGVLSQQQLFARARDELASGDTVSFGQLARDEPIRVSLHIALMSALIIGATGSGKTRLLLHLLTVLLRRQFRIDHDSEPFDFELELVDPKYETFDLLSQYLAALWLSAGDEARERISDSVRVIDWSPDAVTPFAPFDNAGGEISNAYLSFLRTDVAIQSSAQTYTESLRQALFMFNRLLVEKRFPPNYRFAVRLFNDERYRRTVLSDVADSDVRSYFDAVDRTLPRQTREALLRRIQSDMAFPEVRLSVGIPPAEIEKLVRFSSRPVVIGNYGCSMSLPLSKGKERASYRLIDILLAAPRRDPRKKGLLVIEEAPVLLSGSSELGDPLMAAARTLRSAGMGIWFCAQDLANALPSQVVRTLTLNTRWWALFQSREEAEWVYPHVVPSDDELEESEAERHREFLRTVHGLRRQHFYLLVKGQPALPLRAVDLPDPDVSAQTSASELREVFRREIASKSMVSAKVAGRLIDEWESSVVDQAQVPPSSRPTTKPTISNVDDLLRQLGVKKGKKGDES